MDEAIELRSDLIDAFARAWERTAAPGCWWTGSERVAIAAETRTARDCRLCAERKRALSPYAVEGQHEGAAELPAPLVDAVHRIATDPGRLSRRFYDDLVAAGIEPERYVEALGVVVRTVNVDAVHHALGLEPMALPVARPGAPSRQRSEDLIDDGAWVPMLPHGHEFYGGMRFPNVGRALTAVPEEVRAMLDLTAAEYMPPVRVADPRVDPGRAIDRSQMELIAGRVSAINECFY